MAFTVEHAARVAKVSKRRIRYWDKTGDLVPSLGHANRRNPFSRIYSFRDLVGLRTLGDLRDRYGFSLQKVRRVGEYLGQHAETPWSSLRLYVVGHDIAFGDPATGLKLSTDHPGQAIIPFNLVEVARQTAEEAKKLTERRPDEIGRITRNRYVLRNVPVIAGTRIPTSAIWNFHQAGHDADAIIRAYPRLTREDIAAAIAHEKSLHEDPAA